MTEKEKMLRGMLYLADDDPQLLSERMRAKDLCFALNQLPPSHREEREVLAIMVQKEERNGVMEAIEREHGAHTPAQALVISLPIEQTARLD